MIDPMRSEAPPDTDDFPATSEPSGIRPTIVGLRDRIRSDAALVRLIFENGPALLTKFEKLGAELDTLLERPQRASDWAPIAEALSRWPTRDIVAIRLQAHRLARKGVVEIKKVDRQLFIRRSDIEKLYQ